MLIFVLSVVGVVVGGGGGGGGGALSLSLYFVYSNKFAIEILCTLTIH